MHSLRKLNLNQNLVFIYKKCIVNENLETLTTLACSHCGLVIGWAIWPICNGDVRQMVQCGDAGLQFRVSSVRV